MRNTEKGFTLVEVLIVVVIIAILASLIVPRMLMQTEKAKAAEALQMVGAIMRAGMREYDLGNTAPIWICSQTAEWKAALDLNCTDNWSDIGLQGLEKSKSFSYRYEYYDDGAGNSYFNAIAEGGPIDPGVTNFPYLNYMFYNNWGGLKGPSYDCDGKIFKKTKGVPGDSNPCAI